MKSPAFQFYPDDFMGGKPGLMTPDETHVYIWLLCLEWNQVGFVYDPKTLARWCKVALKTFNAAWPVVSECFVEQDGRFYNPRLEHEREKQSAYSARMAENGKKGGRPKAAVKPNESRSLADSKPIESIPFPSPIPIPELTTKTTTPAASRRTSKPKSEPKYPHYPTSLSQRLHAEWQSEMEQNIDYAIFRRLTAKAFDRPEVVAENDEARILETLTLYSILRAKAPERERGFFTPEKWATEFPRLLRLVAMPMSIDGLPTEKARLVLEGMAA